MNTFIKEFFLETQNAFCHTVDSFLSLLNTFQQPLTCLHLLHYIVFCKTAVIFQRIAQILVIIADAKTWHSRGIQCHLVFIVLLVNIDIRNYVMMKGI